MENKDEIIIRSKESDETAKIVNFKAKPAITFWIKGDSVLTMSDEGKMTFEDIVKESNSVEIAKQFIKIVEEITETKAKKLREIINSFNGHTTNFTSKAVLFDKICELYK
jgi:hypothetical protein